MNSMRFFGRPVSWGLIIAFLLPLFFPQRAYALTTSIPQEIAEYEPPGSTDLVNLLTGDFQYSIPLLDVPGRNGGFSLPLSYHAGISMEQDASWVGLGWSLNPGAILRSTSEYPDDIRNGYVTNISKAPGEAGYHINNLFYQRTRIGNSLGGSVGLAGIIQVGFGSQEGNFSVLGLSPQNSVAMNSVGLASTALTIVTGGASGFATSLIIGASVETAIGAVSGAANARSFGSGTTSSDWTMETKGSSFFKQQDFRYYLDHTKHERVYGSLHLQHLPAEVDNNLPVVQLNDEWNGERSLKTALVLYNGSNNQQHMTTDAHFYYAGEGNYADASQPASIAYDKYQVQGESIMGSMQPYRLDIGCVSKGSMSPSERCYVPVPWTNVKAQFRFAGVPSNAYMHHASNQSNGLTNGTGLNESFTGSGNIATCSITDRALADPSFRVEPDRAGNSGERENSLVGGRLIHGKNIEWFTNLDFRQGHFAGKILDHQLHTARSVFRSPMPDNGIGGFAVTDLNGITYHYTIPVLNKTQTSKVGRGTSNFSSTSLHSPYAIAWLLTTITGPQFIDRNQNRVADANDWGDWVRFDYSKFSDDFKYRYPYSHGDGSNPETFDATMDGPLRQVSLTGSREGYYLDRIYTNTHSALFIKSLRDDGRGVYNASSWPKPSSALKLDEIIVLKNDDYERLIGGCSGCYGLGDFSIAHAKYADIFGSNTGDSFDKVLDAYDLSQAMRDYLRSVQILRVVFNYTYELCPGTWNSFPMSSLQAAPAGSTHGIGGKLTLRSISQFGGSNVKLMPDHEFQYNGLNPSYDRSKVDGWGMHCASCGTNSIGPSPYDVMNSDLGKFYVNVDAHQATADGAAWSLTDIITPTGSEMHIDYERDTYSSVFGKPTSLRVAMAPSSEVDLGQRIFKVASNINLQDYPFLADEAGFEQAPQSYNYGCQGNLFGGSVGATVGILDGHTLQYECGPNIENCDWGQGICTLAATVNSRLALRTSAKYGGDLRVKKISMRDPFSNQVLTTSYTYTDDTDRGIGRTTGSVTSEPDLCVGRRYGFERYYDMPSTPVMYGIVTVRSGSNSAPENLARVVYRFRQPSEDMLSTVGHQERIESMGGSGLFVRMRFNLKIRTSGIGDLLAQETFDHKGYLVDGMQINYQEDLPGKLAHYTEGSLFYHSVWAPPFRVVRAFRTTKHYIPSIPVSTSVTTQANTRSIENTKFDFLTGTVVESVYGDSWGTRYRTKTIPAFRRYPGLGSKAVDASNANMMGLLAEDHLYALVNGEEKPVSVGITTYAPRWDYPSMSNGALIYETENRAWHRVAQFAWKDKVAADGTYADLVPFDFNAGAVQDSRWFRNGRVVSYDKEGRVVEVEDVNSQRSATLYGVNGRFVIASGTFAKQSELRFSGAEERIASTDWFEGRVSGANFTHTGSFAHTGKSSLRLQPGQQGFVFEVDLGSAPTEIAKKDYRVSVWVHERNLGRSKLFFQGLDQNGAPVQTLSGAVTGGSYKFKAGKWYLLEMVIPSAILLDAIGLRVGVANDQDALSTVDGDDLIYVDDMRFHPYMGDFTSNVHDVRTGNLAATLDRDNRAVRYAYDALGRITMVEVETASGFVPSRKVQYDSMRD